MNETFVKKFFNGQDPIGRRFNWHGPKDPFFEIVGVVPDGKYNSLGEDPKPALYTPLYQDYSGTVTLVARTRDHPRQVLAAMRATHRFRRRQHDEEPALWREHFRSDHLYVCHLTLARDRLSRLLDPRAQS